MSHHTASIHLDTTAAAAFRFLADPAKLPHWAVAYCQAVRRDADRWFATTPGGEVELLYTCDAASGVIDIGSRHGDGAVSTAFSRVLPDGARCVYSFTFLRDPGVDDQSFDAMARALQTELQGLAALAPGLRLR